MIRRIVAPVAAALFLVVAAPHGVAQDGPSSYARSLTEVGASFTIGDRQGGEAPGVRNLGYGVAFRTVQYFDPRRPWGFYYGIFLSAFLHTAGGVDIGDTRLVHVGWRSPLAGKLIGVDLNLSPVLGDRVSHNVVRGSWYVGVSPCVGVILRVSPLLDSKLALEPVIGLFNFGGGASDAGNLSYLDLSVYLVVKSLVRSVSLDWDQEMRAGAP